MEKTLRRVLVMTYYWPPAGGAGVQRWLKFVKYLSMMGWEALVYTPLNPEIPVEDRSLLDEIPPGTTIIKTPIREPYNFYKRFVGMKSTDRVAANFISDGSKPSFAQKVSVWIRGNFFIPDPRIFWVGPSVRFLKEMLVEDPVDLIVTSGPPHSMHLIGRRLKKSLGIPWVADFRDPWTNIDFYHELMLTSIADSIHHRLERKVVQMADLVITVNKAMEEDFLSKGAKSVVVISNGFDEADMVESTAVFGDKLSFVHIGTLGETRNPLAFWTALGELVREQPSIAEHILVKLVGKVDHSVTQVVEKNELGNLVEYVTYIPHMEAIKEQRNAGVLLLLVNNTPTAKGIVTGKLFEYLATGRPILAIGPKDGEMADILHQTKAGKIFDFGEVNEIKQYIVGALEQFRKGLLVVEPQGLAPYSRKELTRKLAQVMEQVVEQHKLR
ncbi:MAG TPA: glycosyltransferase [Williamwhitmania sp.]|nr:glycosyltransferase [Williamwhitmania sp.]